MILEITLMKFNTKCQDYVYRKRESRVIWTEYDHHSEDEIDGKLRLYEILRSYYHGNMNILLKLQLNPK